MPTPNLSSSSSEQPSPSTVPPQNLSNTALPRTRSIQFSTPDNPMSRSVSPMTRSQQQQQQAESSADEITPIIGKERAGAKNKRYDSTSVRKTPSLDNGVGTSRQSSVSSTRRRQATSSASRGESAEEAKDERGRAWWWKDLADKYGSVELDNKGSVARDHLALERTFLAWLRTSLAFASIGIAITQLFRLNTTITKREGYKPTDPDNTYHLRQVGKPLGATFLGIAILVLLAGGRRYFESQYWIIRGKFPASRGSIFLITFIALALIVTSLIVVCVVEPTVFEKR